MHVSFHSRTPQTLNPNRTDLFPAQGPRPRPSTPHADAQAQGGRATPQFAKGQLKSTAVPAPCGAGTPRALPVLTSGWARDRKERARGSGWSQLPPSTWKFKIISSPRTPSLGTQTISTCVIGPPWGMFFETGSLKAIHYGIEIKGERAGFRRERRGRKEKQEMKGTDGGEGEPEGRPRRALAFCTRSTPRAGWFPAQEKSHKPLPFRGPSRQTSDVPRR